MLKQIAPSLAVLAALASPALALTCMPSDPTTGFVAADQRSDEFVMVLGTLSRNGPDVLRPTAEQTGEENLPAPYSFPAAFSGRVATTDGFLSDLNTDVTVEVDCVSAWCGGVPLDATALLLLRRDAPGTYVFEARLCEPFSYTNPTEHDLMQVLGCLQGVECGATN